MKINRCRKSLKTYCAAALFLHSRDLQAIKINLGKNVHEDKNGKIKSCEKKIGLQYHIVCKVLVVYGGQNIP